jgi:hypothetical protein
MRILQHGLAAERGKQRCRYRGESAIHVLPSALLLCALSGWLKRKNRWLAERWLKTVENISGAETLTANRYKILAENEGQLQSGLRKNGAKTLPCGLTGVAAMMDFKQC